MLGMRARPHTPRLERGHPLASRVRWFGMLSPASAYALDAGPYRLNAAASVGAGTLAATRTTGPWGSCLNCDGTTSSRRLTASDATWLRLATWTVAVLFRAANVTGDKGLVNKGNSAGSQINYFLGITGNQPYASYTSATSTYKSAVSATTVTANRWYHLCGTYDGASVKTYLDGVLVATLASALACQQTSDILTIGRTGIIAGAYWSGQIDGPLVLSGALSAQEVATLAADPFALVRPRDPTGSGDLITVAPAPTYYLLGGSAGTIALQTGGT